LRGPGRLVRENPESTFVFAANRVSRPLLLPSNKDPRPADVVSQQFRIYIPLLDFVAGLTNRNLRRFDESLQFFNATGGEYTRIELGESLPEHRIVFFLASEILSS
jgi:hypothetical protein